MSRVLSVLLILLIASSVVQSQTIDLGGFLCQFVSCTSDQYCKNGECYSKTTNQIIKQVDPCDNVVCKEAEVCKNGTCLDFLSTITSDPCALCPAGTICQDKKCVLAFDPCIYLTCADEQICIKGDCLPIGSGCSFDSDCLDSQICLKNMCKLNKCLNVYCNDAEYCQQGECMPYATDYGNNLNNETDNGNGQFVDQCANVSCSQNQYCVLGICIQETVYCYEDVKACPQNFTCSFGVCIPDSTDIKPTIQCMNCAQNYSFTGDICFNIDEDLNHLCNDNVTCASNETCVFGSCAPNNLQSLCKNTNCPSDEICFMGFCFYNTIRKNVEQCKGVKCPEGICVKGVCQSLDRVFTSLCTGVNCSKQQVCTFGQCISLAYASSCDSVTCQKGEICVIGFCIPFSIQFQQQEQQNGCQVNEFCQDGKCISTPSSTTLCGGKTCKTTQTCIAEYCVPGVYNPSATIDSNLIPSCDNVKCSTGFGCLYGSCVPQNLVGK